MKEQINAMVDALVIMMEREDLPKALAKFYWRMGAALIEEGFSSDEAMEILKIMSMPGATKS